MTELSLPPLPNDDFSSQSILGPTREEVGSVNEKSDSSKRSTKKPLKIDAKIKEVFENIELKTATEIADDIKNTFKEITEKAGGKLATKEQDKIIEEMTKDFIENLSEPPSKFQQKISELERNQNQKKLWSELRALCKYAYKVKKDVKDAIEMPQDLGAAFQIFGNDNPLELPEGFSEDLNIISHSVNAVNAMVAGSNLLARAMLLFQAKQLLKDLVITVDKTDTKQLEQLKKYQVLVKQAADDMRNEALMYSLKTGKKAISTVRFVLKVAALQGQGATVATETLGWVGSTAGVVIQTIKFAESIKEHQLQAQWIKEHKDDLTPITVIDSTIIDEFMPVIGQASLYLEADDVKVKGTRANKAISELLNLSKKLSPELKKFIKSEEGLDAILAQEGKERIQFKPNENDNPQVVKKGKAKIETARNKQREVYRGELFSRSSKSWGTKINMIRAYLNFMGNRGEKLLVKRAKENAARIDLLEKNPQTEKAMASLKSRAFDRLISPQLRKLVSLDKDVSKDEEIVEINKIIEILESSGLDLTEAKNRFSLSSADLREYLKKNREDLFDIWNKTEESENVAKRMVFDSMVDRWETILLTSKEHQDVTSQQNTLQKIGKELHENRIPIPDEITDSTDITEVLGQTAEFLEADKDDLFNEWKDSSAVDKAVNLAYLDYQEVLQVEARRALPPVINKTHKVQKAFLNFRLTESTVLWCFAIASFVTSVTLAILAAAGVATGPYGLPITISLAILSAIVGAGFMAIGLVILYKKRPTEFWATISGTYVVLKLMSFMKYWHTTGRLKAEATQETASTEELKIRLHKNPDMKKLHQCTQIWGKAYHDRNYYEKKEEWWSKKIGAIQKIIFSGGLKDFFKKPLHQKVRDKRLQLNDLRKELAYRIKMETITQEEIDASIAKQAALKNKIEKLKQKLPTEFYEVDAIAAIAEEIDHELLEAELKAFTENYGGVSNFLNLVVSNTSTYLSQLERNYARQELEEPI